MTDDLAKELLLPKVAVVKKPKRGDVRADGKIFWSLHKLSRDGEMWLTPDAFSRYRERLTKWRLASREILNEKVNKRRAANREKVRGYSRKWRLANLEKARAKGRAWHLANREKVSEKNRKRRLANPEKMKARARKTYLANRERAARKSREWRLANPEKMKAYLRQWVLANPERLKEYDRKRKSTDPVYYLSRLIRSRLWGALKVKSFQKSAKFKEYVKCSPAELKAWIESQFSPGMSWGNKGDWHIDHIVPLSLAQSPEDIYVLSHYTNLRPLWASDNLSKSKSLPTHLPNYVHSTVRFIHQRNQRLKCIVK